MSKKRGVYSLLNMLLIRSVALQQGVQGDAVLLPGRGVSPLPLFTPAVGGSKRLPEELQRSNIKFGK